MKPLIITEPELAEKLMKEIEGTEVKEEREIPEINSLQKEIPDIILGYKRGEN